MIRIDGSYNVVSKWRDATLTFGGIFKHYENLNSGLIKITAFENPPKMSHLNFQECFKHFLRQKMTLIILKIFFSIFGAKIQIFNNKTQCALLIMFLQNFQTLLKSGFRMLAFIKSNNFSKENKGHSKW